MLTGSNTWLEKKDVTYLQEYQPITGTAAAQGKPKYYAMFGGATGESDTTSGRIFLAPTPNTNYKFRVHYNVAPALLESDNTNYISYKLPKWPIILLFSRGLWLLERPSRYVDFIRAKV